MSKGKDLVLVTTKAICRKEKEGVYIAADGYKPKVSEEVVNHRILEEYRLPEPGELCQKGENSG